ncbi:MAG: nucleoside phosphorylase [Planctomycetes bacterium]|nr:nucleoside phosphorylase [Planctomycetota bacterium]
MSEMSGYESAEVVKDPEGRQYHIGLAPGEVAPYVLLCGDPARADRVARRFEGVRVERRNREYVTYTGTWDGGELTVMATGIGCDNTEIAVIELAQCADRPTLLRIGTCGGLAPATQVGDLAISTGGVRLENTSTWFVREGHAAVAHHEVVLALIEAASRGGVRFHVGLTASASGFYGAQGREVPGFPPRFKDIDEELARTGVVNLEMECSTLFTLAGLGGMRSGAVCVVYANRRANQFIHPDRKLEAEAAAIETGLEAIRVLRAMDRARASAPYWRPGPL